MTAEEAIESIEGIKSYYTDDRDFSYYGDEYEGLTDDDNEALDMAIKALEQTRWIPVSERLPKEKGNYLVCYNDGYISVSEWHPNPYEKVCFDLFPSLIVAWMPIMPYKAESEG